MRFLGTPHLPESTVRLCAIGDGNISLKTALQSLEIDVIIIPSSKYLTEPVRNHTDLLLHHAGGERVWLEDKYSEAANSLAAYNFQLHGLSEQLGVKYPKDVLLCCFTLGDKLYANPKAIDEALLKFYQSTGKKIISTQQGYTKCCCCIVNSNSVITSDPGLAKTLKENDIHTLQIQPGFIELPGYNYGFIGGCSGLLSNNLLAFYGNIYNHPDYKSIELFCKERDVKIISLCEHDPLHDVGGIIPLLQK